MVTRRARRGARASEAVKQEEQVVSVEPVTTTRRLRRPVSAKPQETAPAPKPQAAAKRDPTSSSRVDYDKVIARYRERATSPKTAIRAKCVECMGGLIAEVDRCTSTQCPLYHFRKGSNPYHKLSKHNRQDNTEE